MQGERSIELNGTEVFACSRAKRSVTSLVSGQKTDAARKIPAPALPVEHIWMMAQETRPLAGRTRMLSLMSGAQCLLGKRSDATDFKRWTVTVGVSLGEDGMVTAQVTERIQSTRTTATDNPSKGWVGHRWYVEIVRIQSEAATGISGTGTGEIVGAAADEAVCRLLEGTEEQRDTLSEETLVQDDADMERLLMRLLPLLQCRPTHSGSTPMPGCHVPEDFPVLQALPPPALPEGGGGDKARGVAGHVNRPRGQVLPDLGANEDWGSLNIRPNPPSPLLSGTIRPDGRNGGSTAAPLRPGAPRLRNDWTLSDFMPASPILDQSPTPDPLAWRKAAVAEGARKRNRQQTQSIQSRAVATGQNHRRNQARPSIQPELNLFTPTEHVDPHRHAMPRLQRIDLPASAPIPTQNFYRLLETDVEESAETVRVDRHRQSQRPKGDQPPSSPRTAPQHRLKPPLPPQMQPEPAARGSRPVTENGQRQLDVPHKVKGFPEIRSDLPSSLDKPHMTLPDTRRTATGVSRRRSSKQRLTSSAPSQRMDL